MTTERKYRVLCPFGGSGGGALGFLAARVRLLGTTARFECVGSIDFDPVACADFERFTGSRALCTDIEQLTRAELVAFAGVDAPDVVFMSPPCKGSSRLLPAEKAKTEKYQRMNRLALAWTRVMLEAWGNAPPKLLLLENVPGLPHRAGAMLRELRSMLRAAGYKFSQGFHCCGEIGGLAQRRKRFLLVARHAKRCPPILYEPPKRRVRAIGEVLGKLPIPTSPEAARWGELHTMPRLSWRNWKRLALIPAGGDWRDLEGVLAGRARREVFRRHPVADWSAPSDAITGPGGHAVEAVADPRTEEDEDGLRVRSANGGVYGVNGWGEASGTITGGSDNPSRGAFSVADVRVDAAQRGAYGVKGWDETAGTVTGEVCPSNGSASVADARVSDVAMRPSESRHWNKLDVRGWGEPALTVIGKEGPSNGGGSVSDPRVSDLGERKPGAFHNIDRVYGWDETTGTVTSSRAPSSGLPVVTDPRIDDPDFMPARAYDAGWGVLGMDDTARTIAGQVAVGQGAYSVAERRQPAPEVRRMTLDEALALRLDPNKAPPFIPMIVAEDGTWHRPLTLLELAALQSYPMEIEGEPIVFGGTRTQIAEHIGNSVPPDAAEPIGGQMLTVLVHADAESWALSGGGQVWVSPVSDRSDTLGTP